MRLLLLIGFGLTLHGCAGTRALVRRGDEALAQGHTSAALAAYNKALDRKPGTPDALLGVARAWLRDGDPDKAIAPARAALDGGAAGAAAVYAQAMVEGGQGAQALDAARKAHAEDPKDEGTLRVLAEATLAAQDLAGASALLSPTLQTSEDPHLLSLGAWILGRQGKRAEAASLATRAAGLAQSDPDIQAEAAAIFALNGDVAGARGAARAAAERGAQADRYGEEAAHRDSGGDREGALRRLSWARALQPDNGQISARIGMYYLTLGDPAVAVGFLQIALGQSPYLATTSHGVTLVRPSDWSESQRRKEVAQVLRALAEAHEKNGDLTGAAQAFEEAAKNAGEDATLWVRSADAWERARDPKAAAEALAEAAALSPNDAALRIRLSRLYGAAGQPTAAFTAARSAWEIAPRSVEAALTLGRIYEERGEPRAARDLYATALRTNPNDPRLVEALKRIPE